MIPMNVTVGPLATADADGICVSQLNGAASGLALNGALSAGGDVDAIATAQAVGGAGALTLDGVLTVSGTAHVGEPGIVTITSAGDDTGITFTVAGVLYGVNGNPLYQSEVITGSSSTIVASTKRFSTVTSVTASGAAAGNVSVGIGGTVTLDKPRRVLVTTTADETGVVFTISGTDWNDHPISEALTGVNATTAYTTLDFTTVTAVTVDGALAGAVTIGTNGVASSRPVFFDHFGFGEISLQATVTGTVSYTIQQTLHDPSTLTDGLQDVTWVDHPDTDVVAATATAQANYAYLPYMSRITLNSGTGSVNLIAIQAAVSPL